MDAKAAAWPCTIGSEAACSRRTSWRMERKCGFSVKESGVGGIAVVVPIASLWEGGSVGRRLRVYEFDVDVGLGKTYLKYC